MFPLKHSVILCIIFNIAFSAIIEKYAGRICNLKEEKGVNECLQKAIQHIFDNYPKGSREIGLISLGPLELPHSVLNANRGGPTQLQLEFTNSKHHNISKSTIKDVEYDIKTGHLIFSINTPPTLFEGTYKMSGKILALPINGNGAATIQMSYYKILVEMDLKEINGKNNKKYIDVQNVNTKVTPGKTNFNFENLFGNKDLSDNMNKFLNENDKDVVSDVVGGLELMYNKIIGGVAKSVFGSNPSEELAIL